MKIRFKKTTVRQLILFGAAAAGLLFLFIKAQPVDPDMHNLLAADLRELQTRDIELGETVLQIHYRLHHNYDAVITIMQRMQTLHAALLQHRQNGLLPNTPEVTQALDTAQQQIERKQDALEQFKSDNAVIKNAFVYLPRLVNDVRAHLPTNALLGEPFESLLRDALLISINQDSQTQEVLQQDIGAVEQVIPRLPHQAKSSAEIALRHALIILSKEKGMATLLAQLSSFGKNRVGTELEQLYLDYYQAQQHSAVRYRLMLFLAAILMLGYVAYAYYRMLERRQELRIAATAFETQEGILITDVNHRTLRVNRAFTLLTGYSAEEAIGQTPEMLKSGQHDKEFYPAMWETIAREKYWQGEIWSQRKNGEIYLAWLTTTMVAADDDSHVTHYVSVFSDITQRKQAEEQIQQLAFYDALTKLPNRRLLIDRLHQIMATGTRHSAHSVLLFIDLDNFKTLNDTKGHDVGDLLLIEAAQRLQACVRGGDTVARLGGDEFVVMFVNLSEEVELAAAQAKAAGEKIRESLSQPYRLRNFEYHSSCSIGISLFRANDVSVDDLFKRADTAMYQAKASGRNALRFFDPSMQAALENRSLLEADLRQALSQQQFVLFYQVQVNSDHQPIGVEVLLRWKHPARGVVEPTEFIPLAEESGLILPIGLWVLETACAQIKAWETNPLACELSLAVNMSARQFHQPDFVEQVREVLGKTGVAPNRLKIELTESVVLNNINDTITKMHALKQLGVQFSMDDFGTGYSSLSYLTQLPLDQLKIDQSFVHNIDTKPADEVIVQTIIGMGNSLGIEVIAEGVETDAQRAFLKNAGCIAFQGYLFSKPVSLDEFESLVLSGGFAQDVAKV